jgi:hypothetical protein
MPPPAASWVSARGGIQLANSANVVLHEFANASDIDTVLVDTDHPPAGFAIELSSERHITSAVITTCSTLKRL